mgnify:CR=1 FL=1
MKLVKEIFGKNLKRIRKDRGVNQQHFVKYGISQTLISEYENGNKLPNEATLSRLIKILNTTEEELFQGVLTDLREQEYLTAIKDLTSKVADLKSQLRSIKSK